MKLTPQNCHWYFSTGLNVFKIWVSICNKFLIRNTGLIKNEEMQNI